MVVTVVTDEAGDSIPGVGQLLLDIWTRGTMRPEAFRTRVAGTIWPFGSITSRLPRLSYFPSSDSKVW